MFYYFIINYRCVCGECCARMYRNLQAISDNGDADRLLRPANVVALFSAVVVVIDRDRICIRYSNRRINKTFYPMKTFFFFIVHKHPMCCNYNLPSVF